MPVAPQYLSIKSNDGLTVYAVFRRVSDLEYYNTFAAAFESFNAAHWYGASLNNYSVAATKTVQSAGIAADYSVNIPSMLAGVYFAEWYVQQGATPAVTDGPPSWVTQNILWNGTTLLPTVNGGGNEVVDVSASSIANRPVTIVNRPITVTD